MNAPEKFDLDLGDGHWLSWFAGRGTKGEVERAGGIVWHLKPDGEMCAGSVVWSNDYLEQERRDGREKPGWLLTGSNADARITLYPSIQCSCGDHGFIREGRWAAS